jgi:hypothetical protein
MLRKRVGLGLFALGALFVHTIVTLNFILAVVGLSLPYMPQTTTPGAEPGAVIPGYIVSVGAILMVAGGLVYKQEARR